MSLSGLSTFEMTAFSSRRTRRFIVTVAPPAVFFVLQLAESSPSASERASSHFGSVSRPNTLSIGALNFVSILVS